MAKYRITESKLRGMIREAVRNALYEQEEQGQREKAYEIARDAVAKMKSMGFQINMPESSLEDHIVKTIFDNNMWIDSSDSRFMDYMVWPTIEYFEQFIVEPRWYTEQKANW